MEPLVLYNHVSSLPAGVAPSAIGDGKQSVIHPTHRASSQDFRGSAPVNRDIGINAASAAVIPLQHNRCYELTYANCNVNNSAAQAVPPPTRRPAPGFLDWWTRLDAYLEALGSPRSTHREAVAMWADWWHPDAAAYELAHRRHSIDWRDLNGGTP